MVMRLPERDQLSVTRAKLKADIAVAMGGRVAEEMTFGSDKVTSGASSDIKMATSRFSPPSLAGIVLIFRPLK